MLAILHAVDIIAKYITSSVDLQDAATRRKESYKRGFKKPFFLTTSEPDLKARRPIFIPKKLIYCTTTKTIEGSTNADELCEFNKMMFKYYRNILVNGGDEANADVQKLCQEGMAMHQP